MELLFILFHDCCSFHRIQPVVSIFFSFVQNRQTAFELGQSQESTTNNMVHGLDIITELNGSWYLGIHMNSVMTFDSGGWPPTLRPSRLGLWVRRKLSATIHTHHRHCYPVGWYPFYRPTKGERPSRPRHYRKGAQPVPKAVCPRLYIAVVVAIDTTAGGVIGTLVLWHGSQTRWPLRIHCDCV